MTQTPDNPTNRRSFITAAAAASATPGAAAEAHPRSREAEGYDDPRGSMAPSRFIIDLGGVHLPDQVARDLNTKIRRDVLDALAAARVKGVDQSYQLRPGLWGYIMKVIHGRP